MKRTGKAVLLVRPVGKELPAYWACDRWGEPQWMTVDVEDGMIVGRSLGIWLEFAFPARQVNDIVRQWRSEEQSTETAWELTILTLEMRKVARLATRRDIKPDNMKKA